MRIEGSEMPDFNRKFMHRNLDNVGPFDGHLCLHEYGQYEAVLIR